MIERACVLMRTIDAYCQDSDAEAIKDDTLTHDDWGDLKKIKEILAPLYKFTKDLEGCVEEEHLSRISDARFPQHHEGMLYEVIMALEAIPEHLNEQYKLLQHSNGDEAIFKCVKNAVKKLDKYLELTWLRPILWIL
ncbi:MAG: hypothetical protein MMC33_010384 [Icmadophila ericetorum]|nr:hypothetical protein [Icmadophila ericetorum]